MVSKSELKPRLRRALEQARRAADRGDTKVYDQWMAVASNIEKELAK